MLSYTRPGRCWTVEEGSHCLTWSFAGHRPNVKNFVEIGREIVFNASLLVLKTRFKSFKIQIGIFCPRKIKRLNWNQQILILLKGEASLSPFRNESRGMCRFIPRLVAQSEEREPKGGPWEMTKMAQVSTNKPGFLGLHFGRLLTFPCLVFVPNPTHRSGRTV